MLTEIRTGPIITADGAFSPKRSDKSGAMVVQMAHGDYQEAVVRNNVFSASNQASAVFTLFGTTTSTGFALFNPTGSGKNLVLLNVGYVRAIAMTTNIEQLVLTGSSTLTHSSTTALTIVNNFIGGSGTSVAAAYSATTLSAAGTIRCMLQAPSVSATATVGIPPVIMWDVQGLFVLAPGSTLYLASGLTNTQDGMVSMIWEEVPA